MSLLTSLAFYLKLDESSGDAIDATGSLTNFTDTNSVGSASGKINTARQFTNASNNYLTHADATPLSMGDIDFSFSMWINPGASFGDLVVFRKDDLGTNREYGLYFISAKLNFYAFHTSGGVGEGRVQNNATITASTWYHVVGIHDAGANTLSLIVNDGTPASISHTGGAIDGTAPFGLGGDVNSAVNNWNGLIDEFGLWKRVLTAGEVTELFNAGAGFTYPFFNPATLPLVGAGYTVRRPPKPSPF